MRFLKNPVGRKLIMAVSGFGMIAFVLVHLLGNAALYSGPDGINTYASALHRFPPLIAAFRLTLAILLGLHAYFGIQLTLENRAAKPVAYAVHQSRASTFASRNMIWSGLAIGIFLVYHLLHFTIQVLTPELAAGTHPDKLGRPDVFSMIVHSFQSPAVSLVYLSAMAALGLHLLHSMQSAFQSAGLNSEHSLPIVIRAGMLAALLIFLGFAAMPIAIYIGLL